MLGKSQFKFGGVLSHTHQDNIWRQTHKKHTGECWNIVKLMVEVFLRDTRKSIVGEDTAYVASDPHMRMDQYFLHTIQSHIVMTEFR